MTADPLRPAFDRLSPEDRKAFVQAFAAVALKRALDDRADGSHESPQPQPEQEPVGA